MVPNGKIMGKILDGEVIAYLRKPDSDKIESVSKKVNIFADKLERGEQITFKFEEGAFKGYNDYFIVGFEASINGMVVSKRSLIFEHDLPFVIRENYALEITSKVTW